jgi:hypothetical protein
MAAEAAEAAAAFVPAEEVAEVAPSPAGAADLEAAAAALEGAAAAAVEVAAP